MSCQSLSSCVSRLSAAAEDPAGLSKALSELRSRYVSRAGGAGQFRKQGGLAPLVALLTDPSRAAALGSSRRNVELALSLLANCCTDAGSRIQVRELGGIPALICILQSVCIDSIWNRVSRALGNLALDPQNSTIIHESDAVSFLVQILQSSQDVGCLQSCLRALRILGDNPPHRLSICQLGGMAPCVQMLTSPESDVVCAAARALCELSRGCSLEFVEPLSPAVPTLMALVKEEQTKTEIRQAVVGTLCNLCNQGSLRPILGSAGIIRLLITEVHALLESPTRCLPAVKALCFCCREGINRVKVRELGGLELLLDLLRSPQYRSVHRLITTSFIHYFYDTAAVFLLGIGGLPSLLAEQLEEVVRTAEERERMQDMAGALDEQEEKGSSSFDFPSEPVIKKEQGTSEKSLRSWLLSEGYINSLEDVLPEWIMDQENQMESTKTKLSPQGSKIAKLLERKTQVPQMITGQLCFSTPKKSCQSPIQKILLSPSLLEPRTPVPSEVCGPEFPLLLLLTRFSQLPDPSTYLVTNTVLNGLLTYITCHPNPSYQAVRLLQRLTCEPLCLEAFIRTGGICTLRTRLILQESPEGEDKERNRQPERAKELGHTLLRNLCIQAESRFGVGVVTHMLVSGPVNDRQQCALCLPFIYRKDSSHRQNLLAGAIRLVLEPLMLSTDPVFFFHASECLFSILSTNSSPALPPKSSPPTSSTCCYLELFSNGQGDIVFVLDGGERLAASRDMVSKSSEVFQIMLQGGYAESKQHEVHVREVPHCAFLPLLHYLHGCSQDSLCPTLQELHEIKPDQELIHCPLASTLAAAGRFLLPDLQCILKNAMQDSLTLDSLPSVYNFAEVHEIAQLRKNCCMYLLKSVQAPYRRAHALLQLCELSRDKQQLSLILEDVVRGRD